MKLTRIYFFLTLIFMSVLSCTSEKSLSVKVIETSKNGNKLSQITSFTETSEVSSIRINPEITSAKKPKQMFFGVGIILFSIGMSLTAKYRNS